MDSSKLDAKTIMELKRLSESSHAVINNLTASIRELRAIRTDHPQYEAAMQRIMKANIEADELLKKQQYMITFLK